VIHFDDMPANVDGAQESDVFCHTPILPLNHFFDHVQDLSAARFGFVTFKLEK